MTKKVTSIRMSAKRRQLMFKVMDGAQNQILINLLWHFDRLRRCDEFLKWMIDNHYTGQTLTDMVLHNKLTPLNLAKWIQTNIDKVTDPDPIIAGKDYNPH